MAHKKNEKRLLNVGTLVKVTNVDGFNFKTRKHRPTQQDVGRTGYILGYKIIFYDENEKPCDESHSALRMIHYTIGVCGRYVDTDSKESAKLLNVTFLEVAASKTELITTFSRARKCKSSTTNGHKKN